MRKPTSSRVHKSTPLSSRIPVAAPVLDGREAEYVRECLTTTWISSNGRFIGDFERAFAEYCGVRHAISVNNGTAALHLSLVALGIGPGDEVIMPTLTYVATANAVRYCNAKPVFVDSDLVTYNLDPTKIAPKITSRTKAIIPVHLYGHPADMDPILKLAEVHNLVVVEDAAEAVGARYKGHRVGSLGACATFSFYGNKIITTGEGGMVTTNDDALAHRMRQLRGQGMDPQRRYWFPVVGYNYRMTNIAAAIGLAQLERIDRRIDARQALATAYNHRLAHLADRIALPKAADWAKHVYWMYTIRLLDGIKNDRDRIMQELEADGIETRPVFYPMHVLPPYRDEGAYPHADHCSSRGFNLPTHELLTKEDINRVADALEFSLG